jgi:hypothetical protein
MNLQIMRFRVGDKLHASVIPLAASRLRKVPKYAIILSIPVANTGLKSETWAAQTAAPRAQA